MSQLIVRSGILTLRLPLFLVGMVLVFVAERYQSGQAWWTTLVATGFLMQLAAFAIGVERRFRAVFTEEKSCWAILLPGQVLLLLSQCMYFGYQSSLGAQAQPESTMQKVLLGTWLALFVIGIGWSVGSEWGIRSAGSGRFAESKRVARSTKAWVSISLLLVGLIGINFASVQRSVSWDLSYLKTSHASPSTKKILESVSDELQVGLFFTKTNEVRQKIDAYFEDVAKANPKVIVTSYDAEVNLAASELFKVSKNGQIVLKSGDNVERIDLGQTLSGARKTLKSLDGEFQKALLSVTAKKKNLYFTRGHGEFDWMSSSQDGLKSLKLLESFLRTQNFNLRYFGIAEGSAKEVPADADAVVVIGGDTPMLPEEVKVLDAYLERGGSLFVLPDLDKPNGDVLSRDTRDVENDPLLKLLARKGIKYVAEPLANTENFVAATRSDVDSWFLFTNSFSSHASVSPLAKNEQRVNFLTFRSGYLEVTPELSGWLAADTVRTLADSFADVNKNFAFDEGKEKKNPYVIGAVSQAKAVSASSDDKSVNSAGDKDPKRGRLVVLADASAVSDTLIRNQANLVYVIEALRWSVGDSVVAGTGVAASQEDVKIQHTRKEDLIWFYGTVILVPLLVLGLGYVATRRSGRKARGVTV